MMLQTPERSPYDLNFQFLGFPVRVTWTFWLVAAALGYSHAQSIDYLYGEVYAEPNATPGKAALLAVWIGVMFVSILVHELGHTLAFRYFGIQSQIVLSLWRSGHTRFLHELERSSNSARQRGRATGHFCCRPVAQLLLGLLVAVIALSMRCTPGSFLLSWFPSLGDGLSLPSNAWGFALIDFLVYINFAWALLNLVPILPLDGGRIAQSLISIFGRARRSLRGQRLEYRRGALLGLWFIRGGDQMLGIMSWSWGFSNWRTAALRWRMVASASSFRTRLLVLGASNVRRSLFPLIAMVFERFPGRSTCFSLAAMDAATVVRIA